MKCGLDWKGRGLFGLWWIGGNLGCSECLLRGGGALRRCYGLMVGRGMRGGFAEGLNLWM